MKYERPYPYSKRDVLPFPLMVESILPSCMNQHSSTALVYLNMKPCISLQTWHEPLYVFQSLLPNIWFKTIPVIKVIRYQLITNGLSLHD